jgi:hypothetical protein
MNKKSSTKKQSRQIFADKGWPSGQPFFQAFLSSPEVNLNTLQVLSDNSSKKLVKNQLADILSQKYYNSEAFAYLFWKTYVLQHRSWCAIRLFDSLSAPEFRSPNILLREMGEEGWYGPISTGEATTQYYLRVFHFQDHLRKSRDEIAVGSSNPYEFCKLRWITVLKITPQAMCLSWDGFTRAKEDEDEMNSEQFKFWKYVPTVWQEVQTKFTCLPEKVDLYELVLHYLWDFYVGNSDYQWSHLHIRARSSGVSLNARSSPQVSHDLEIEGLQQLSTKISESIQKKLNLSDSDFCKIENTILRTLIHEWGTRSYDFKLSEKLEDGKEICIFRGHCYFGNVEPQESGIVRQDSLQHIKTYKKYGGLDAAFNFMVKHARDYSTT